MVGDSAVYKMAAVLSLKWRWNVFLGGLEQFQFIGVSSLYIHDECVVAELKRVNKEQEKDRIRLACVCVWGGTIFIF